MTGHLNLRQAVIAALEAIHHQIVLRIVMMVETALCHVQRFGNPVDRCPAIPALVDHQRCNAEKFIVLRWRGISIAAPAAIGQWGRRPFAFASRNAVAEDFDNLLFDAREVEHRISPRPDGPPQHRFDQDVRTRGIECPVGFRSRVAEEHPDILHDIAIFLEQFVLLFLIERADFRQGRDKTVFPAADAVPQLHMKLHELGDPLARRRLSQCLFCRRLHQGDGLGINRNDQLILARKIIGNAGGIEPDCPRNLGQGGRLDAGFVDEHRCRVNDRAAFFAKLLRHIGLLCHPIPHPNRLQQVPLPVQWGRRGNPQRMLPMSRRSLRVPF